MHPVVAQTTYGVVGSIVTPDLSDQESTLCHRTRISSNVCGARVASLYFENNHLRWVWHCMSDGTNLVCDGYHTALRDSLAALRLLRIYDEQKSNIAEETTV